jgi:Flp pilus assembly protein TadG
LVGAVDSPAKSEYPKIDALRSLRWIAREAIPAENAVMARKTRQSGQALIAATFGLVVLLGAAGLAVDMGYLRYQKRLQQSAADSAALAAASDLAYVPDGASITTSAQHDAVLNGFAAADVTVTPDYLGNPNKVRVVISVAHPTFFMPIFGAAFSPVTVAASAVALATPRNCIYNLSTGAPMGGAPTPPLGCRIVDNEALADDGAVPAADPLGYLKPPPIVGGCRAGGVNDMNPPPPPGTPPGTLTPVTLTAGWYCGGISVSGGRAVTLSPGAYVVTGGGISFNGTGIVTGAGVTLYLGAAGGAVSINTAPGSSRTINLTAPAGGALAGILFYQNHGNAALATIHGVGATTLEGALYFPGATLNLNHTGTGAGYTIAVANNLLLGGTTHFPSDYSPLPGGSPLKTAVLVE